MDASQRPAGGGAGQDRGGSWHLRQMPERAPGFDVLSETLSELVEQGLPIVACTADLKYSNGLVKFQELHPERFLQFGISEQNMVTAAAGLATTGLEVYAATFASFLALLCCEQIRTDVAYTNQKVRLIAHHSGITLGFYGTSHHATEDLAIMRSIARLTVVAPADAESLAALIRVASTVDGPIYFRIGRGREPEVYDRGVELRFGEAIHLEHGDDLTIIATGTMVHPARDAVERLRREGHSVGLIDMHTIKPLDETAVLEAAARSGRLMTVEEHNVIGGLGGAVAEVVTSSDMPVPVHRHGIRDTYSLIGPPTHLYRHYGLDATGIESEAIKFLVGSGHAA
jgi:transketolase